MRFIRTRVRRQVATSSVAAVIAALIPAGAAVADVNPATQNLTNNCVATPSQTTATLANVPSVGVGETARIGNTVHFDAGTIYQDVLARPDGSTYFASMIETTWLAPAGITFIPGSVELKIAGVVQPTVPGTQPSPTDWVLETISVGTGTLYRVYFPGDAAAMLADPTGAGLPSVTVPAGGADYSLTFNTYAADVPANQAGTVHDVAECYASISTGPSNRTSARPHAQLGILEPTLTLDKRSLSGTDVAAGAILHYRLALDVPLFDPDTLTPSGDPAGITVVDTIPSELIPLDGGNNPLADGGTNAAGGVWNATARTLTYTRPHIAAGTTLNIDYPVMVDHSTGTGVSITNSASATWSSAAEGYPSRNYGPSDDSQTVTTTAPAPTITKKVDKSVVGIDTTLNYTIFIDFPASGSPFYNATVYDTLPSGMSFDGTQAITCLTGCTDTAATIAPYTSVANGWTRFGWYFGNLPPGDARTFEIKYTAHINSTYHTGAAIPLESTFTNKAEARTNAIDRLGAVVPQAAAPPTHDVIVRSDVTVTYSRPILSVVKELNRAEPVDPSMDQPLQYTITVTNIGGNAASYFTLYDWCASSCNIGSYDYTGSSPDTQMDWGGGSNAQFSFNGSLPPGESAKFVYNLYPNSAWFTTSTNTLYNRVQADQLRDPFGVTYPERPVATTTNSFLIPNLSVAKSIEAVNGVPYTGQVISTAGAQITYKVVVTNTGTGTATITSVEDAVPGAFVYQSVSAGVFGSQSSPGSPISFWPASWPWSVAPNGGTTEFEYTVDTNGTGAGTRTNTVTVKYTDITFRDSVDGRAFTATSQATATLEAPVLRIAKTPDLADNQYLLDGGTSAYSVRVSNTSPRVSASNVSVDDVLPASLIAASFDAATQVTWSGSGAPGTVSQDPSWSSIHPKFLISELLPGQVVTIQIPVTHDGTDPAPGSELLVNSATVSAVGATPASDTGAIRWEPATPNLVVSKSPDPGAGAVIAQGGTGTYTIEVKNDSHLAVASPMVIDDPLPASLSWSNVLTGPGGPGSNWSVVGGGAVGSLTVDPTSTATHAVLNMDQLLPGQTLRITLLVTQDNTIPAELDFLNTATASANGAVVSDDGLLTLAPNISAPAVSKSVAPAFGAPNTPVVFTVTATMQQIAATTYDTTIIDTLPDGFIFDSYGAVTCTSGCPAATEFAGITLPTIANADGSNTLGWYFGDRPIGTGPTTFTMLVNAHVATTFSGTGTPAAGTAVADGVPGGDPLVNIVRSYINTADKVSGVLAAIPATPNTAFALRSPTRTASFDVRTPAISLQKTSNADSNEVEAGDTIEYTLTVTNTGSADAYDIAVRDDMAQGKLINVDLDPASNPLPSGTAVTDGWSLADPTVKWLIAGPVAPGATLTIHYTATTLPSSELTPADRPFAGEMARINNTARVVDFHTAATGSPGDFVYTSTASAAVKLRLYTPLPQTGMGPCWQRSSIAIGDSFTITSTMANYLGWVSGFPAWQIMPTTTAGTAYDSSYVVTLPSDWDYQPNSSAATGPGAGDPSFSTYTAFAEPTISPDGRTLTWDLGDIPPSVGWLTLQFNVIAKVVGPTAGITAVLASHDAAGAVRRGDSVAALYNYSSQAGTGACGVPQPASFFNKGPDNATIIGGDSHTFDLWFTHALGRISDNPVIVDTMPAGLNYTPGSATVTASIPFTESIVANPDGTTQITWAFAGSTDQSIHIQVPVGTDPATPYNVQLVNTATTTDDGGFNGTDIGQVLVKNPVSPTVLKTVAPAFGVHGDSFTYTVTVTIPANADYHDLIAVDRLNNSTSTFTADLQFGSYVSAACISGCTPGGPDDIVPQTLAPNDPYQGMLLGDIAPDTETRTVQLVYTAITRDLSDPTLLPYLDPWYMTVYLDGWTSNRVWLSDSPDTSSPGSVTYDPSDPDKWMSTFNVYGWANVRDTDSVTVDVKEPRVDIRKSCESLDVPDDDTTKGVDLSESIDGVPNFSCSVTIENQSEVPAYDLTVRDTPPTQGDEYLAGYSSYVGPIVVTSFDVYTYAPYAPDVPLSDGLGYMQWAAGDLDAGESRTFTYTGRMSGTPTDGPGRVAIYSNVATLQNGWLNSPTGTVRIGGGGSGETLTFKSPDIHVAKTTRPEYERLIQENPERDQQPFLNSQTGIMEWNRTYGTGETIPWVLMVDITNPSGFMSVDVRDVLPYGVAYKYGSARLVETVNTPLGPVTNTYPIEPAVTVNTTDVCDSSSYNPGGDELVWNFSRTAASPANRLWLGQYATNPDMNKNWWDPNYGQVQTWQKLYHIEFDTVAGPETGHCLLSDGDWWNAPYYTNVADTTGHMPDGTKAQSSFNDVIQIHPDRVLATKGRQEISDLFESYGCGSISALQFHQAASWIQEETCPGLAAVRNIPSLGFATSDGKAFQTGDTIPFAVQISAQSIADLSGFDLVDTLPYGMTYKPGTGRLVIRANGTGPRIEIPFEGTVTDTPPADCLRVFESHWDDGDLVTWNFHQGAPGAAGALWNGDTLGNGDLIEQNSVKDTWYLQQHSIDGFIELRYEVTLDLSCVTAPNVSLQNFVNNVDVTNLEFADGAFADTDNHAGDSEALGPRYVYGFDFVTMSKSPDGGFSADDTTTGFDITITNYAPVELSAESTQEEIGMDLYHLARPVVTDTFSTAGGSHYVPGTATVLDQDGNSIPLTELSVTVTGSTTTVVWELPDMPGSDTSTIEQPNPDGSYPDPGIWTIHVPIVVPYGEPDGMVLNNHADLSSDTWQWVRGDSADITIINPSPPPTPTKSASPAQATINDTVTYTVDVPVPDHTVYFDLGYKDVVPDGLEFLGYQGVSCTDDLGDNCMSPGSVTAIPSITGADGTTTLQWWLGDLVGSARPRTYHFTYKVRVKGTFTGGQQVTTAQSLVNVVRGFANDQNEVDSVPTLMGATDFFYAPAPVNHALPIVEPTVSVTKAVLDPTTPRAALDTVQYTLTITNTGDGPAYDIRIVDDPPAYLTNIAPLVLTGAEVDGWTAGDPHMEWYFGALQPGESHQIVYTAQIVGNIEDYGLLTVDNVASASEYRGRDLEHPGNRVYAGAEVTGSVPLVGPVIHVEKYADAGCTAETVNVNVGDEVEFCVAVTNPGTGLMHSVDVRDLLPIGWSYKPGSGLALSGNEPTVLTGAGGAQLLTWSLGDVPNGLSPIELRYIAIPGPTTADAVTNRVVVEGRNAAGMRQPPSATAYHDSDVAHAQLFQAALEIKKTPDFQYLPYAPSGGPLQWDIEVSNPSDATHANVIITDTMPAGLTYVPGTATSTDPGFSEESVSAVPGGVTTVVWRFASLPPHATYRITINSPVPAGITTLTSYLNDVEAVSDQISDPVVNQARVVIYGPNAIGDKTFIDLNGDGVQQTGEPPLAGVTVRLLDKDGVFLDSRVTDSDGLYLFDALLPGSYFIEFVMPVGYELSPQNVGDDDHDSDADPTTGRTAKITVASLEDQFNWDAGFIKRASVGNFVWEDRNNDGLQSAGEPGISGATVELLDGAGHVVGTTTTNTDGHYSFTNLLPGTYSIRVTPPAGAWRFSPTGAGSDGTLDSDGNASGVSASFTLISGLNDVTRDMGMFHPVNLAITKTTPITKVEVGATVEWNLEVENTTTNTAYAPTHVIDPLPSSLQFISASSDLWSCTAAGQIVDCVRTSDIVPGERSSIVLRTKVLNASDSLINVASVASALDDDSTDNEDDANIVVLDSTVTVPTTTPSTPSTSDAPSTSVPGRAPTGTMPVTGAAATMTLVLFAAGCIGAGVVLLRRRRRPGESQL